MRVTGGEYGGQTLVCPQRSGVRPTENRVRQALFNVLGEAIIETTVLDMFAGTGAVGIEALSRGAKYVLFMEKNPAVARSLRANLQRLRVNDGQYKIMVGDALKLLTKVEKLHAGFDLAFIDPPYQAGLYEPAINMIKQKNILKANGIMVLEYSTRMPAPVLQKDWQKVKTRTYGETALDFWFFTPAKEE